MRNCSLIRWLQPLALEIETLIYTWNQRFMRREIKTLRTTGLREISMSSSSNHLLPNLIREARQHQSLSKISRVQINNWLDLPKQEKKQSSRRKWLKEVDSVPPKALRKPELTKTPPRRNLRLEIQQVHLNTRAILEVKMAHRLCLLSKTFHLWKRDHLSIIQRDSQLRETSHLLHHRPSQRETCHRVQDPLTRSQGHHQRMKTQKEKIQKTWSTSSLVRSKIELTREIQNFTSRWILARRELKEL